MCRGCFLSCFFDCGAGSFFHRLVDREIVPQKERSVTLYHVESGKSFLAAYNDTSLFSVEHVRSPLAKFAVGVAAVGAGFRCTGLALLFCPKEDAASRGVPRGPCKVVPLPVELSIKDVRTLLQEVASKWVCVIPPCGAGYDAVAIRRLAQVHDHFVLPVAATADRPAKEEEGKVFEFPKVGTIFRNNNAHVFSFCMYLAALYRKRSVFARRILTLNI